MGNYTVPSLSQFKYLYIAIHTTNNNGYCNGSLVPISIFELGNLIHVEAYFDSRHFGLIQYADDTTIKILSINGKFPIIVYGIK